MLKPIHRRHPVLAIVGRPNVGKSTLFNRFAGKRKAIVFNTPGLTRDRNFDRAEWRGREFVIIDTGGYEPGPVDDLRAAIREQTTLAIEQADSIIFLVDVREGLTAADHEIVDMLRRTQKPLFLAVNKCDTAREHHEAYSSKKQ
ncbi:MAG: 50S ribosome-binding GTPase [Candidatus Sumerlaeota bacterium]|nr:50S ribosome-binding GTPase [Candidatus Sumerlaeota bacterium]